MCTLVSYDIILQSPIKCRLWTQPNIPIRGSGEVGIISFSWIVDGWNDSVVSQTTFVGTASATSPIPRHLCIFTLMASHAIINLCPWQACSYPLFCFTTTWYYSLTLHWFLYHHFFMIPWLCNSVFSVPFISCHVRFLPLRRCTTSECDIWGELLYIHDTSSYIILTMYL